MTNIFTHYLVGYAPEIKQLIYTLVKNGFVIKDYTETTRHQSTALNFTFKTDCPEATLKRLMPNNLGYQHTKISSIGSHGRLQRRLTDSDTKLVE